MLQLYAELFIVQQFLFLCDCLFYPKDSTNDIFNATLDVGAPEVTCQFLIRLVTSATCTIQYGTDPTYVNLPYIDSSNGTNVYNVTVSLSTPLQGNTRYYYVVSSMGVKIQGSFQTGTSVTRCEQIIVDSDLVQFCYEQSNCTPRCS